MNENNRMKKKKKKKKWWWWTPGYEEHLTRLKNGLTVLT